MNEMINKRFKMFFDSSAAGGSAADAEQRAAFYDAAHNAGVSNLKLAYAAAVSEELFDKKGNVDFAVMKEKFPFLFPHQEAPGDDMNARIRRGAGQILLSDTALSDSRQSQAAHGVDMNAKIRRAAGRDPSAIPASDMNRKIRKAAGKE